MKKLTLLFSIGVAVSSQVYAQNSKPVEVDSPVDGIFVPSGFDDNDNVEVVLHGTFPDACHHVGATEAKVDEAKRLITVSARSEIYPDEYCVQSLTPFIQSVEIGNLTEGSYKVVLDKDPSVKHDLEVAARKTESPDDYLFATVENAYIDLNKETGKQSLKLQGHFPFYLVGCMVIREVRVVRDPVDVLVVQPIAEVVNTDVCASQPIDHAFDYTVGLPEAFQGEGLLHVRTLNGTSLNRLINIP